ncbi:hypothetical protein SAMN05421770_101275 [Granulicella rosea]|uniref:Uncharacterized protein n=2 Tax=Granulicella rosea TaxID=474952 RepID=A0A239D405_9BACT|nr:hypothetical protein SAMN05421770_101275 [Granulicella rosea]
MGALVLAATRFGSAQTTAQSSVQPENQTVAEVTLPDSPGFTVSGPSAPAPVSIGASSSLFTNEELEDMQTTTLAPTHKTGHVAGVHDKYINPGDVAPHLTVFDKVILGVKHTVLPISATGWVLAASYEQITNSSPNYGQTFKGFSQRLGASAARGVSEGVFSDSVLASVLKEDPRYYRLGKGKNPFKRIGYAATRTLFTRTDGGASTVNFSLLGGNLAGAAMTQAYYPAINRGFGEVAETFAGSVAGSAFGFVMAEFLPDYFHGFHRNQQ